MARPRLFWKVYKSYLFVTVLSLLAALFLASYMVRDFYHDRIKADLEARAVLIERQVRSMLEGDRSGLDAFCKDLGKHSGTRITVIIPGGTVIADSEHDPSTMDNHADRPEVKAALSGGVGDKIRFSHTLSENMVYVAVPVVRNGRLEAVARASVPLASVVAELRKVHGEIMLGGLAVIALAAVIGLFVSRAIAKPLVDMRLGAMRFAAGGLDARLEAPDSEELGGLAEAMNEMAQQLGDRIETITRERNERHAILAAMVEGVIAVDPEQRVISINRAAIRMLGLDDHALEGKTLQEAVRNTAVQGLVKRVLATGGEDEEEVAIEDQGPRYIQAHCSMLSGPGGETAGAVLVMNDITRLKMLDIMKSDFAANVSHELRTPITSVKGFVETLLDGALDNKDDAKKFLEIIGRQVNQLNAIIGDLLTLSTIEQDAGKGAIALSESGLREMLEAAVEVCAVRASAKDIKIELQCDNGITALMSPALMTQAVVNLVDNAVGYSDPGAKVAVMAEKDRSRVRISVADNGRGIEKEHLPRLFERFYRVDKARSRKQGGTGLGLAIVKHIVTAHGGSIQVESEPGKGSTFSIRLPLK